MPNKISEHKKAKPERIQRARPTQIPQPALQLDAKGKHSVTIVDRRPEEVYAFWRDLSNLAKFMKGISEIKVLSPRRSIWTAKLKSGSYEWEAEITDEEQGRRIAWQSLPESDVKTSGTVWFSPAREGTVVSLALNYDLPGGKFAELAAFLMGEHPDTLAQTNLYRLRALLETGEIPTTEGQSSGRDKDSEPLVLH